MSQKAWLISVKLTSSLVFMALLSFGFAQSAFSQESLTTTQAHSTAHLVFNQEGYTPGQKLLAGLFIELEEAWHTYWLNPGDSGAPVIFEWNLPKGWTASPIHFPPPLRIPTPPLQTFGFEGKVLFYAELSPPPEASEAAEIGLAAEWLVCKDICIPAFHNFKTQLKLSARPQPSSEEKLFREAKAHLPQQHNDKVGGSLELKGGELTLLVTAPPDWKLLDFFPGPKTKVSNQQPKITLQKTDSELALWKAQTTPSRASAKVESSLILAQFEAENSKQHWVWLELKESASPLLGFLFFAFVGGIILNLMPCVFPIISMKFFSLLKHSGGSRTEIKKANSLYVLGVLCSFWVLALVLFFVREGGEALGWGFQLQSPGFVIFLVLLFSLMAFNFLGWFELQFSLPGLGRVLQKDGPWGHFLTGVLSTIVASPCTAPFMGVSVGFALSQPLDVMLLIFTSLGLGLSFPYILLSIFPQWATYLPRPGAWMERLKTFMAFPLLATVIWLTWSLSFQVTATSLAFVWSSVLLLGFIIWADRNLFLKSILKSRIFKIVLVLLVIWLSFFNISKQSQGELRSEDSLVGWQTFSPELVTQLRDKKLPVFVDFTAAWCITCQVNKQVTFSDGNVIDLIKSAEIQMLTADWTNRDPVISRILREHGRAGVPLYLFYPAGNQSSPLILPEILTPSIFKKNIEAHL